MNYSWSAKSPDVEKAQFLSSELKISHFLSKLLINRNIDSYEEAHQFLHPYLEKNDGSLNLPDPFLLKGMEDGVQRIIRAIESSENIAVYGDFDCDGITSTAILYSFSYGPFEGGSWFGTSKTSRTEHFAHVGHSDPLFLCTLLEDDFEAISLLLV